MPVPVDETELKSDSVITETTKIVSGTVKVFGKGFWDRDTPTILAKVTKALRYFCVGVITSVSATDLFSGRQAKIINFSLGLFILALGGVDIAVGVEPDDAKRTLKAITVIWMLGIAYETINYSL